MNPIIMFTLNGQEAISIRGKNTDYLNQTTDLQGETLAFVLGVPLLKRDKECSDLRGGFLEVAHKVQDEFEALLAEQGIPFFHSNRHETPKGYSLIVGG